MSLGELLFPSIFLQRPPRLAPQPASWLPFRSVSASGERLMRIEARVDLRPPSIGSTVAAGDLLGTIGDVPVLSPIGAKVTDVRPVPYLGAGRTGLCVTLEPDTEAGKAAALPALGDGASREDLLERLDDLGVCSFGKYPVPLSRILGDDDDGYGPRTVIVVATDVEPLLASQSQLLAENRKSLSLVMGLIAKAAGTDDVRLAVLPPEGELATKAGVEAFELDTCYPSALPQMVARHAVERKASEPVAVLSLESALGARRATTQGLAILERYLTVIGADETVSNVTVEVGTPISAVLDELGFLVEPGDLVIFGGPMMGQAEYLLDAGVDITMTGLMIIDRDFQSDVQNDPCVSCGNCVDVCPVDIQPQLLGRNAEFGFFDRNVELDLECCVLCGLCSYVCPCGRPISQWIELTLAELARPTDEDLEDDDDETADEESVEGDDDAERDDA